ncbi:magnesium/cobalt transporter CorA [Burkholderiaceae bacterium DAT-1]|nr:magnesium/cobalt transporter CorA [Burkholderiaceae bacterium DAT-1]
MLINCVAYQDGHKLAAIPQADISDYIARPECMVWVALADPDAAELDEMREEFGLHELAIEDVRKGHQRPKLEEYGETLFVVLHLLSMDAQGAIQTGEVGIFVGGNYVLSVRSRSDAALVGVRERCEETPDLLRHGAGFVLYALLDEVIDRYFPIIHALEVELEQIESRLFAGKGANLSSIEDMYTLKRKVLTLQHSVIPLLDAVSRLNSGRAPDMCRKLDEYYRDLFDHLDRMARSIEGLREMVNTAMQVNLSMISLHDASVNKKLAAWAAIFAVPTMIAGIYGMNFEHMPELKWAWGYPLCLLAMVVVDGALWWKLKRAGWL